MGMSVNQLPAAGGNVKPVDMGALALTRESV